MPRTVLQTHPSGSIFLRVDTAMGIGTWVNSATPVAHHHVGSPRHARVDRVLAEEQTERRVVSIGRHAPDGVAGIDVLEVQLLLETLEMCVDVIAKEQTDVAEADVARSVPFLRSLHHVLARPLPDHDDGMPLPVQPLFEGFEKALKRKGNLRNRGR